MHSSSELKGKLLEHIDYRTTFGITHSEWTYIDINHYGRKALKESNEKLLRV